MNATDLHQHRRHNSFIPFRLRMDDGQTFEIHHPELLILGKRTATVGFSAADEADPVYESYHRIAVAYRYTDNA